ncbi:hypothetical protein [Longispora albida]|uniref:hypothetical protein n=1 Tax=Longispora albida TaxID=203523 RepID=UPI000363E3D1|nr:hypothetical protein [Longispora albida]
MNIKRTILGLTVTAVTALGLLTPAVPAQAVTLSNCWYWPMPANVNLEFKICAQGGNDLLDVTAWVTNRSGTSNQYVRDLTVWSTFAGGYAYCSVMAWLPPKTSRHCSAISVAPVNIQQQHNGWGRVHFWSPTYNEYQIREGSSPTTIVY